MYTVEESDVFQFCEQQVMAGCKTSGDLEKLLWKKYPLISHAEAYKLVRSWILNCRKIEDRALITRTYSNEQNNQENNEKNEQRRG
jgi:hypothetical protein